MNNHLYGVVPYPEQFKNEYRKKGYWIGQNISDFFIERVKRYAQHTAVIDQNGAINYQDMLTRIERCASALYQLGIRANDKAIVQLPNRHEFYVVFFALIRLGALPIMSLPAHRHAEINSFIEQTQAKAYFCADFGVQRFDYREQARICQASHACLTQIIVLGDAAEFISLDTLLTVPIDPVALSYQANAEQVAFLQLSGGSTGTPKLIPRTHDDYLYSVRQSAQICRLTESSRLLMLLPAAHNFAMSSPGSLGIFYVGGAVVLGSDPSADVAFELIKRHNVTDVTLVPALVHAWVDKAKRDQDPILSQLNYLQVGGARLSSALATVLIEDLQVNLQQVFGMAEGLVNYTRANMTKEQITNTQGTKISPDDEILVLDDNDQPVAVGEIGHLLTRGPYTIRGYFNAPEHNQRSFTPDGFYRTGDLVRLREDGCIVVEGRAKEQINRGGEKIATEEVEQAIMTHERVTLAALVAMPDTLLGEKSCLFIQWQNAADDPSALRRAMQLRQYLQNYGLATYKIPDKVEFIDEFPYTAFGKIDKKSLRYSLCATLN